MARLQRLQGLQGLAVLVALVVAAAAAAGAHAATCYEDPTQTAMCTNFTHPAPQADAEVANLCMMMGWMAGCSVENECARMREEAAGGGGALDDVTETYCASFSVLADICAADMPGMGGCRNYTALCATPGSVVAQCTEEGPMPGLPTTAAAATGILGICTSHRMSGCELCTIDPDAPGMSDPGCDLVAVYSSLCLRMPDMVECVQWQDMCATVTTWTSWCPSADPGAGQPPIMRMYFHTGIVDYVLFYGWVPRTDGQYIATLLAVVALAIAFEGLRTLRHYLECRWASMAPARAPASSTGGGANESSPYRPLEESAGGDAKAAGSLVAYPGWAPQPFRLKVDLVRATVSATETLVSYSLMLIAMTFNVGLFLAVVVGVFIGSLLFGRYRSYQPATTACC